MEADRTNPWREAVIDELVTAHTLTSEHESNPRKAVQDAISWNVSVALDPLVSSQAKALIDQGRREALTKVIQLLNGNTYNLTKSECVHAVQVLRDKV